MVMDQWDDRTGLPSNNVLDVLQDRRGYVWLASYDGLVRFDGKTVITSYSIHYTKLYESMTRLSPFSEMALVGHSLSQAAQLMHASEMT